ncbi:hypothetical protein BU14_0021s0016 [Porphyra umbilicalis]|uniref:Uncharacterized protein n=1 Tax=Porphyra umbilicalis TaxID=2786 RepID=A0A1X6PKK1_PORUM|nr:hypothetical protein BU14_0021s0016 [Porphyra umbilicalis]|eukprot:OSX81411.1 hypothetical protein BU14_0021s0016 [Porphyra umbilicalis]
MAPALSAEGASAATARTVRAPTTTAGASGDRHEQPRPRSPTAASTAEAAAPAAEFSAAVTARPRLATLRAAPSAGPQDGGALTRAFAAAGALARAAPAMPEASEAATSEDEDAEAADDENRETLGQALGKGGCGWILMADAIPDEWTAFVRRGARRMSARTAQPIINSQLHELMEELGDTADIGRRQVAVPSGGRGRGGRQRAHFARQVRLTLATVAARVGNALDVAYDGVTPHLSNNDDWATADTKRRVLWASAPPDLPPPVGAVAPASAAVAATTVAAAAVASAAAGTAPPAVVMGSWGPAAAATT